MLDKIFQTLDVTKEEGEVYVTLLELGQSAVGEIARHTSVPRPSLYALMAELHGKGLVSQSVNAQGVKVFQAEPPERINQLFEERLKELRVQQEAYKDMLPMLREKVPTKLIAPRFHVFEGEEGVRHVLKDMLLYRNTNAYAYFPMKAMVDILGAEFFFNLNKERIHNNIFIRVIWPKDQLVDVYEHPYFGVGEGFKRDIRISDPKNSFSMGYWIYANKVAYISSRKESFGLIVESAEMAEMQIEQFEAVWSQSKEFDVDEAAGRPFLEKIARG